MKRTGGLDGTFLAAETSAMHMHVCGLLLLDTSTMPEGDPFDHVHAVLARRLPKVAAVRQRLVPTPLHLGHPYWADDPDLDIDRHIHRLSLGTPGDNRLAEVVGDIASTPLPRDRPLWEIWAIDGVAPDRMALLVKMHHSVIDGVGGANLMGALFDLTPTSEPRDDAPPPRPPRLPRPDQVLCRALRSAVAEPIAIASLVPRTIGRLAAAAWQVMLPDSVTTGAPAPFTAPRVSFNTAVTKRRAVAFNEVPMADIVAIKQAFGVTVNDVVTAVVGGGLRRYLAERGELPDRPLIAAEPVSVHGKIDSSDNNTQVSVMFASLGTNIADPAERLEHVAAANKAAKAVQECMGDDLLLQWIEHAWLKGVGLGTRLYSTLHLADHHPVVCSLILSNVSGPRAPLYLAGGRLVGIYPLGPIMDGIGLNITVLSEDDRLGFGVMSCPELVPDVWRLVDTFPEAVAGLKSAAADGARLPPRAPVRPRSRDNSSPPLAARSG